MALLTLLKNWKEALIGFLGVAFMLLFTWFKYRGNKIDKLEHEIKIKDAKEKISKKQKVFKKEVVAKEPDEILKEIAENEKESRDDRVNKL